MQCPTCGNQVVTGWCPICLAESNAIQSTGHVPTPRQRVIDGIRAIAERMEADGRRLKVMADELNQEGGE